MHSATPPPGRLAAAERAADLDRFAGDHLRHREAVVHRVGVHDPGHRPGVGPHIRRRDVPLRTEQRPDLSRVAAGQPLQLADRQAPGGAGDAAFGPAEGDADQGALPGHGHRHRAHLVEVHVRRVADAALGRAARQVVLDAVPLEDGQRPVVDEDREAHRQLALAGAQDGVQGGMQVEALGNSVELREGVGPGILYVLTFG
jgi:hypothetical protein